MMPPQWFCTPCWFVLKEKMMQLKLIKMYDNMLLFEKMSEYFTTIVMLGFSSITLVVLLNIKSVWMAWVCLLYHYFIWTHNAWWHHAHWLYHWNFRWNVSDIPNRCGWEPCIIQIIAFLSHHVTYSKLSGCHRENAVASYTQMHS